MLVAWASFSTPVCLDVALQVLSRLRTPTELNKKVSRIRNTPKSVSFLVKGEPLLTAI